MEKKSIIWSMLAIIMVAMLSVGFAACGDDDDNGGISGIWKGQDGRETLTLIFNSGYSGTWIMTYEDKYSGTETTNGTFTYTMVDNNKAIVSVNVPDEWYSGKRTGIAYAVIEGNKLTLYEHDFFDDLEWVLYRQ